MLHFPLHFLTLSMHRHRDVKNITAWLFSIFLLASFAACQPAQVSNSSIKVKIVADGDLQEISVPIGSTVQKALDTIGLELGELDRVKPPTYSVLGDNSEIIITRLDEEFFTTRRLIPFGSQTLLNESMPSDQQRLIQSGINGEEEVTTRILYENGVKSSQVDLVPVTIKTPVDEIIMIGVNNPFSIINIFGRIVYLTSGNAWIMEDATSNRRALVTSGDLDGRVFTLSPDGQWLLFSRKSSRPLDQEINTLWVMQVTEPVEQPINLRVSNIIHFAGWRPGDKYTITYSTVEPRATPPGWQANNDLYFQSFDPEMDNQDKPIQVLEASSGGIYGWWGTSFSWSPDGERLAYSRCDSIGLVDVDDSEMTQLFDITPFNTHADWAWLPALAWASNSQLIYFVKHSDSAGITDPDESPLFELDAYSLQLGFTGSLVSQTGMFAYPAVSPADGESGETAARVAFLQAIFPLQSLTSRYRLTVIDRDGSEPILLFPPETQIGIEPQTPVWAPEANNGLLAILNNGNIWIINTLDGNAQQVTGDGLTSRIDWK